MQELSRIVVTAPDGHETIRYQCKRCDAEPFRKYDDAYSHLSLVHEIEAGPMREGTVGCWHCRKTGLPSEPGWIRLTIIKPVDGGRRMATKHLANVCSPDCLHSLNPSHLDSVIRNKLSPPQKRKLQPARQEVSRIAERTDKGRTPFDRKPPKGIPAAFLDALKRKHDDEKERSE